jgi:hypothetical protein
VLAWLGLTFGDSFQKTLSEMTTVFHGLDIVIGVLLLVAIGLYIYRHVRHARMAAEGQDADVVSGSSVRR